MDLATLVVKLEAQSAQYVAELDKANKQLSRFHADAKAHMDGIAGTLAELKEGATKVVEAFAIKEIGEFFNRIIEGSAEMRGLSKETGIAVEDISALSAAAQTKGVDDLGLAMNRLARAANESLNPTSDAAAAFKSIGVSAVDSSGKVRPLDQIFLDVADAFKKYQDNADKSSESTTLLGKAGFKLINFMDEGRSGINEIVESMGGFVRISKEGAENSEKFEENLVKLKLTYNALAREGIEPVLPDLIELEEDLLKVERAVGKLDLVSGPLVIGARIIRAAWDAVGDVLKIIPASFDFISQIEKGIDSGTGSLTDIGTKLTAAIESGLQHASIGILDFIVPPDLRKNLESKLDSIVNSFVSWLARLKESVENGAREIGAAILDFIVPPDLQKSLDGKLGELADTAGKLWSKVKESVQGGAKDVGSYIEDIVPPGIGKGLAEGADAFSSAWSKLKSAIHEDVYEIRNDLKGVSNELTEFKPDLPNKEKPRIKVVTGEQLREQDEALKQLKKVRETIDDQVASFGLGSVAVMKYSLEFGKLHDVLKKAGAAGKIEEKSILDLLAALEKKKNEDALTQISAHMDELKNNTASAAAALFDLQNRQLKNNLGDVGDKAGLDQLNHLRDLTIAQAKYNDLQTQAAEIQDRLKLKEDAIQRAVDSGAEDELTAQGQLKDARERAVTDLDNIYQKLKAISDANAKDMPKLVQSTDSFKSSLDDLQVKTNEVANKMRDDVTSSAADAWASWVDGEKSARDAFGDFIKNIEREISQLVAKNLFEGLFKQLDSAAGGGGSGFFSNLANLFIGGAGARTGAGVDTTAATSAVNAQVDSMPAAALLDLVPMARGGTIKGQRMYVVGEHGPEIIVPTHAGVVIPNHRAHALVGGLAPRSFAHRGSIAEQHSNMIQVRAPKSAYQTTAVHIGKQQEHRESVASLSRQPRQEAMIHAAHSPQFVHRAEAMHAAAPYAHRALGGPVTQNRGTMVGEYGPELYAPIVNNAQLENNRMDRSVHVTNHFVLPPGGNVSRATQAQIASSVARSVQIASVRNQ